MLRIFVQRDHVIDEDFAFLKLESGDLERIPQLAVIGRALDWVRQSLATGGT